MAEELADIADVPQRTVELASTALHRAMDMAGFEHTVHFRFYAHVEEGYRATAVDWRDHSQPDVVFPAILCGQALPGGLGEDELTAAFLHELYHLRRHFNGPIPLPSPGSKQTREENHAEEFAADAAAARWMGDAMPMMRAIALLNIVMEVPLQEDAESHPAPLERVGRLMQLQREIDAGRERRGPGKDTKGPHAPEAAEIEG